MTARFIIGDTRDVTATLPDGSVDLVIPEHAPNVLGEAAHQFSACADELLDARCRYAIVDDLVHPSASLGIRQTHREAQVACDIWHALGGGMESRRDDRLTNVRVSVSEVRA